MGIQNNLLVAGLQCKDMQEKIVCMYEGPVIEFTPAQFGLVLAFRQKVGHTLSREDLLSIIETNGGDDGHR